MSAWSSLDFFLRKPSHTGAQSSPRIRRHFAAALELVRVLELLNSGPKGLPTSLCLGHPSKRVALRGSAFLSAEREIPCLGHHQVRYSHRIQDVNLTVQCLAGNASLPDIYQYQALHAAAKMSEHCDHLTHAQPCKHEPLGGRKSSSHWTYLRFTAFITDSSHRSVYFSRCCDLGHDPDTLHEPTHGSTLERPGVSITSAFPPSRRWPREPCGQRERRFTCGDACTSTLPSVTPCDNRYSDRLDLSSRCRHECPAIRVNTGV